MPILRTERSGIIYKKRYKIKKNKGLGVYREKNEKSIQKEKRYFSINQLYLIIQIIGIIYIIIGIGRLIQNPRLNPKLTIFLILIGYLLYFIISEIRKPAQDNDGQLTKKSNPLKNPIAFIPEITSLSIIIWASILYLITNEADFGIFFVCIFLGILVVKELTDTVTTIQFKKKMNMFIIVFLIGTILIIAQKIITL